MDQSLNVSNGAEVITHRKSSAPSRLLTNLTPVMTNAIWFFRVLTEHNKPMWMCKLILQATLEGKTANIAHMHSESESNQSVTCHLLAINFALLKYLVTAF